MTTSFKTKRRYAIARTIIGIIIILIQVLLYYVLFFHTHNVPYISIISLIVKLLCVSIIYNSDKNISYKLNWIIIILIFNLAGACFYLIFGTGRTLPKRKNKKINAYLNDKLSNCDEILNQLKNEDLIGFKHASILHSSTDGYCLYDNIENTFFNDGNTIYLDMLDKIKNAKKFIFLEYFIIGEGSLFNELFDVLKEKALSGIEIKIMYDAVGCNKILDKKTVSKLNNISNIKIIAYNPLGTNNLTINYRNHRKITVVDGLYAYTGGFNLADEYIHRKDRFGHWRDNGILIEGKATYSYTLLFAQNWYMSTQEMLVIEDYKPIYNDSISKGYIFPFGDGPITKKSPSYDLFLSLINNAQKSIYISTPYFIIDIAFINAIAQAIKSGVDVKILLPEISDKKFFFPVTLEHCNNIILSGGEVYRYTPGFNHAKNIIVDGKYAFIGTVNVDYRSLFLNFECGNLLINTDSVKEMQKDFVNALNISKKIELNEWNNRSITNRIRAFAFTLLGPLL